MAKVVPAVEAGRTAAAGQKKWSGRYVVFGVALAALAVDLMTKAWAEANLVPGQSRPLLGNFITLQLVYNPGAAFSLGENFTWVFTVLTVIVILALIWFAHRVHSPGPAVILGLLLGGALGNLWDRLSQPPGFGRGHVVDFLNYNGWFVGNVADIWIVVAAIALLTWLLTREQDHQGGGHDSQGGLASGAGGEAEAIKSVKAKHE